MGRGAQESSGAVVASRFDPQTGAERYEHKGVTIEIVPDPEPLNPRDYDNATTFYCWHPNYQLGDQQFTRDDYDSMEEVFAEIKAKGALAITPLFLYDHSGLSVSLGQTWYPGDDAPDTDTRGHNPFDSAGWDTTMIGFAYVSPEHVATTGIGTDRDSLREAAVSELQEYNDYLQGNCWGYVVAPDTEEEESCWGFLGEPEYCKQEAENIAESIAAEPVE